MRIECPSCAAAYEVPAERLAAGRAVKCARCTTMWSPVPAPIPEPAPVPAPIAPLPPPPPPPIVEPAPVAAEPPMPVQDIGLPAAADTVELPDDRAPVAEAPPRRAPLILAWMLSLAVLGALGWLAIDRRGEVMRAWPPSIRGYVALGLLNPPPR